jgi:hypothetical protein
VVARYPSSSSRGSCSRPVARSRAFAPDPIRVACRCSTTHALQWPGPHPRPRSLRGEGVQPARCSLAYLRCRPSSSCVLVLRRRGGAATSSHYHCKPTPPAATLDPPRATTTINCPSPPRASPGLDLQRSPPPGTATRARRQPPCPKPAHKSSHGGPHTISRAFPRLSSSPPRWNYTGPSSVAPRGPHRKTSTPPEGKSVNRGHICEESKPSGTSLQISFFNSIGYFVDSCKIHRES